MPHSTPPPPLLFQNSVLGIRFLTDIIHCALCLQAYRETEGVDIQGRIPAADGYYLAWIQSREWTQYSVIATVEGEGMKDVELRDCKGLQPNNAWQDFL